MALANFCRSSNHLQNGKSLKFTLINLLRSENRQTFTPPISLFFLQYSYEAELIQKMLRDKSKIVAESFNHTCKYKDNFAYYAHENCF
jgi:hypothetical protein